MTYCNYDTTSQSHAMGDHFSLGRLNTSEHNSQTWKEERRNKMVSASTVILEYICPVIGAILANIMFAGKLLLQYSNAKLW